MSARPDAGNIINDNAGSQTAKASGVSGVFAKVIDRGLRLISSVPFGVSILGILLFSVLTGTLVLQRPTADPERFSVYYNEVLMPAERIVYGAFGFFDVYHVWWFVALMFILALNITLTTIDHFPVPWHFYSKPKLNAPPNFIKQQMCNQSGEIDTATQEAVEQISQKIRRVGLKPRITSNLTGNLTGNDTSNGHSQTTIFAQRGVLNRFGFVFVHIALITTLTGGLLTSRYGVNGFLALGEGDAKDGYLPRNPDNTVASEPTPLGFTVATENLRQELIDPAKGDGLENTVNWYTSVRIIDRERGQEFSDTISVNHPLDYRGYRFFQSGFQTSGGAAKAVTLKMTSPNGQIQNVIVRKTGAAEVPGLGTIKLTDFQQELKAGTNDQADSVVRSGNKASATLAITASDGKASRVFAYDAERTALVRNMEKQGNAPPAAAVIGRAGDWKFELASYDPDQSSTLQVQHDPGARIVYIGSTMLMAALFYVFFFSHQRVWAVVEPTEDGRARVYLGGHTNRARVPFTAKFKKLAEAVYGRSNTSGQEAVSSGSK
ncbi:MAG: cytochrome c biogenesis protein ResB [Pyrinomonadaceae bacterium]